MIKNKNSKTIEISADENYENAIIITIGILFFSKHYLWITYSHTANKCHEMVSIWIINYQ